VKARLGFISNSSSSNFIINAMALMDSFGNEPIEKSRERVEFYQQHNLLPKNYNPIFTKEDLQREIDNITNFVQSLPFEEAWDFEYYKGYLLFSTMMDNCNMLLYLEETYGKRKVFPALEINPHQGFKEEIGLSALKGIVDNFFYHKED
jgi:hypothetical protein